VGNQRDANIRIGSTERENAVAALAEHLGQGRLEVGEYDQRCALATAARTRGELAAIFEDLPDPHPDYGTSEPEPVDEPAPRALIENNPTRKQTTILLVGLLVFAVVAVTVVTALTGAWWAFIPILIVVGLFFVMS
jgi:hypothetical protein